MRKQFITSLENWTKKIMFKTHLTKTHQIKLLAVIVVSWILIFCQTILFNVLRNEELVFQWHNISQQHQSHL